MLLGCAPKHVGQTPADAADVDANVDHDGDGGSSSNDGGPEDAATGAFSFQTLSLLAGAPGGVGSTDGTGVFAEFHTPACVVFDGKSTMYLTDEVNDTIRKIDLTSRAVTTIAGKAGLAGSTDGVGDAARFNTPASLTLDGAGHLYVSDRSNYTIRAIDLASGMVTTVAGTAGMTGSTDGKGAAARFYLPQGLAYDGAGTLYVADGYNHMRKIVVATGMVSTLATTGTTLDFATGIVLDGKGNLFIADDTGHTIDKLVLSTGVVTVLAGTSGISGTADGTGAAALFQSPVSLSSDGAGNLFTADGTTVREIVIASGKVTTLAGVPSMMGDTDGVGSAARFAEPYGIAYDGKGDLYIVDPMANNIRELALSSNAVTTPYGGPGPGNVDGTGTSAQFATANGVVLDGNGNLYVADTSNGEIRKVVVSSGVVTTLVKVPAPYQLALDGKNTLYVAGETTVRAIDLTTTTVTIIAGTDGKYATTDGVGAAASFTSLNGLYYDGTANLYVSDDDTIRRVELASATVTTIAGKPGTADSVDGAGSKARFSSPRGLAGDGAGNLYVADQGNATIRKLVIASASVSTVAGYPGVVGTTDGTAGMARFDLPSAVAFDGAGSLYVTDAGSGALRRVTLATAAVDSVLGGTTTGVALGPVATAHLGMPFALFYGPGPTLYIGDSDVVLTLK